MPFTKLQRFTLLAGLMVPLIGLILFTGLMMPVDPKPGDPMPVDPIQAINRYVEKTRKEDSEVGRRWLRISDHLSQDEKEWYILYFSGNSGLTRAAIEKCKSLLQLYVLVEKNPLKNPENYEYFTKTMQSFARLIVTIKETENYQEWTWFMERIAILLVMLWFTPLVILIEAIHFFDLKSWCSIVRKVATLDYRILVLEISFSLSQKEKEWLTLQLSSGDSQLNLAVIEECKSFLQLYVQMEEYAMISPGDLESITKTIQSIENIAIVKNKENYQAIERSSVHNIHPSSGPSYQSRQGGGVTYNTGNQSNMRSNSTPTSEGYTQNPSWGGQGYQGKPPSQQQQPYHNYPQQQYYQPQQRATPSYSQQNPQQWQQGQQPAIKTEPEDRTSSATSGLTVGPERPKWYYEAVQKIGPAYADNLWETVVQKMRENENELRKKMQEMKIAEQRRAAESTPSVKTEPSFDKREASVTRDLRLGPIEATTRSPESQQSSTLTYEGHRIVPDQTTTVIPHTNTVAGHVPDLPKYKMDRSPRGICIIFNAENFTRKGLKKRDGTQKDVEALLNTFQNRLKFKTQVVQDPTKKKYIECLQEIARMDHSEFDCFVGVILSHGCEGCVYGKDGEIVSIDSLTGLFKGDYVPSLVDKPKLFFIQACQGKYPQQAVAIQQDAPATLPNESDTLVSLCTVLGYTSNRNRSNGTLFITSLCEIINKYYKKKVDLLSMLTVVNELMSRRAIKEKWKQIGNPSHTLRKQIFFNQGLDE